MGTKPHATPSSTSAPANLVPLQPKVFERDGEIFTNSLNVAAYFEKRRDNVLRDIRNLLKSGHSSVLRAFRETTYRAQNGKSEPAFDMTRDGFTLLAMGFAGAKALTFKLRYIEAFNRMEATLRQAPAPGPRLDAPRALRAALLGYTERVIDLEGLEQEMAPNVEALKKVHGAIGGVA